MPSGLTDGDTVLAMIAVLEIIAEVLLAKVEVVKPEISLPSTERRMSPTNPSTTSEAPLLMLDPASWAWGMTVSQGGSVKISDDTVLDEAREDALEERREEALEGTLEETLDEMTAELATVLLTELLGTFELC